MGLYPSVNDATYDLLKKIATNSAVIADSGGGGGGTSYSQAANFSALPPAALFTGTTYLVLAAQGVYFVNRKPSGLYRSDGANWNYMADATEAYFGDAAAWGNITSKPSTFTPSAHAANHSAAGSDPVTITNLAGFTGDTTKFLRADGTFQTAGGGTGDVVGPASAVDERIAVFNLTTGKLIKDGGKTIATVLSDAATDATTKANAAQAAAIAASQPVDGDLTAIAALTPANDDILQRKAGAWTNRTIAQLITDLSLTSSSVGLGNVTNDAQTKAAIVPNTAPAAGEILVGNAGGTAYAKQAMSGDATMTSAGVVSLAASKKSKIFGITIDGAGTAIATGVKGYLRFPLAGTITKVTLLADQSGSIVIDVWKDTYANFPPTDADSITSAAPPTITTATKSEDSTLTGWTTAVSSGDCIGFNVDSCTSITRVTLEIEVTLT